MDRDQTIENGQQVVETRLYWNLGYELDGDWLLRIHYALYIVFDAILYCMQK